MMLPFDSYDSEGFENVFEDQRIRQKFIRKVYSILLAQILMTMAIMAVFIYYPPLCPWVMVRTWLLYVSMGLLLGITITLACCESVQRKTPMNYILLGVFTVIEACTLGIISCFYRIDTILWAAGITAVIVLLLTILSFQTTCDFTRFAGYFLVAGIAFMIFGLVAMFIHDKTVHLVYACLGAILFCGYIIFDTQLMLGGKHMYTVSPEDYVFAALKLYVDIVGLFMMILQIFQTAK